MIEVKDLVFRYKRNQTDTIKNVSFNVEPGEIFGFLGPSGAGKSTLQKIMTGLLVPFDGRVQVLGEDVSKANRQFYERIGVDFEFPNFYGKCTPRENLAFFASLYSQKTRDIDDLVKRVGLSEDMNKKVADFSKGMKMRLAFVRALLHDPDLLFLDEPTGGLDPSNARILKNMILEEKSKGKSIILTTHNMNDAAELCDRVAFIVDGQIEAMDTPEALQTRLDETEVRYSYVSSDALTSEKDVLHRLGRNERFMSLLREGRIVSIHSKEKTLEDVFIELTGRQLS